MICACVLFLHPFLILGAFYIILVALLELLQTLMGQPVIIGLRDILHFSCALAYLVTQRAGILGIFMICAYETVESCAYFFTGRPVDRVFIDHIDPMFTIRAREWGLLTFGVGVTAWVCFAIFVPFFMGQELVSRKSKRPDTVLHCGFLVFLQLRGYVIVNAVSRGQEGRFNTDAGARQYQALRKYFTYPISTKFKRGVKPKNIIEIIPESFELQFLGDYNRRGYKKSMPFLSALAKNSTFFPNVSVGLMTYWSAGSICASQCGIPLVATSDHHNSAQMMGRVNDIKCIGDYLKELGYNSVAIYPGDGNFGGIKPILMKHGFGQFFDYRQDVREDSDVVNRLEKELPKVVLEYRMKLVPFYLFIGLEDTHPNFKVLCDVRKEHAGTDGNKCLQAFDCMDQKLETIMGIIRKHGLTPDNTIIIIHGDHPLMRSLHYTNSVIGSQTKRKMAFIFPFSEPKVINKPLTVYDITPTLFDMLQIGYSPEFPFGRSAFSDEPGQTPTEASVDFLWEYLKLDRTVNSSVSAR